MIGYTLIACAILVLVVEEIRIHRSGKEPTLNCYRVMCGRRIDEYDVVNKVATIHDAESEDEARRMHKEQYPHENILDVEMLARGLKMPF